MSSNFHRLSPFIKEYVYKSNWDSLNEIQEEACRVVFDTDDHLLLTSGTASGKTEAAFLPALTVISEDPPASIGILYIAPMKALINDQFYRLDDLLKEAGIPVCCWHGDVPQSKKSRLIRNPAGVLQITPESMESMLLNRNRDLVRLFGDLRFVIIDEVHAFMGSDRGIQVLCQLERLQKYIRTRPRRIGLSATLGDYTLAQRWLSSGTDRATSVVSGAVHQKIRLSVEQFNMPILETEMSPFNDPTWPYLYEKSLGKKCIIFSNGREVADAVITNMRYIAAMKGTPDIYHVHHGSISGPLREEAETDMKESEGPVVTGATVTLEMGIDIGRLERVIQIGAPISVQSLVQRLGRSGRRGNPAEMFFVDWETLPESDAAPFPERIPWRLLQIIAMLQLYLEERWMEPPKILKYPLNMLYQQIMSVVASAGEMSPRALANQILTMESFRYIRESDFQELIMHLLTLNHLQLTEEGGLIIGLAGEKIINNYKFYAVFTEEETWSVMHGSQKIGTIEEHVKPSQYMTVAGKCWVVKAVDDQKRLIFVEEAQRKIRLLWLGDRAVVHNRILQRMKQALFEDTEYPYLQENAAKQLKKARKIAREYALDRINVFDLGGSNLCVIPWMGHVGYYTLLKMIRKYMSRPDSDDFSVKKTGGIQPYYFTFKLKGEESIPEIFLERLKSIINSGITPVELVDEKDIRQLKKQFEYKEPKYDRYVPEKLLKKQVIADYIDLDFLKNEINRWNC